MMKNLSPGQKITLFDSNSFVLIKQGQAEIYALSSKPFGKEFLAEFNEGEAIFPWRDNDENPVSMELYAENETVVEFVPIEHYLQSNSREELCDLMTAWFYKLVNISWVNRLLTINDDTLISWRKKRVFKDGDYEKISLQNEIFLTLLKLHFAKQYKSFELLQELRDKSAKLSIENSARLLLGEDVIEYAPSGKSDKTLKEAEFIVSLAAQALNLPISSLSLPQDTTSNIDPVNLLHLLAKRNNMSLRYVTLPKNWQNKDYGVMIGYFGKEKTLCAILRAKNGGYLVKTIDNTHGEFFASLRASESVTEAFLCCPCMPEKKLNKIDLLKFVWRYVKLKDFQTVAFCSLLMGVIPILLPVITEIVFTDAVLLVNGSFLIMMSQIVAIVGLTLAALYASRSVALIRISYDFDMRLHAAFLTRILNLPPKVRKNFSPGDLTNKMGRLEKIRTLFTKLNLSASNALFSLWSLVIMAHYSKKITALVALFTVVMGLFLFWRAKGEREERKRFFNAKNQTINITRQIFDSIGKFRVQNALNRAFNLWGEKFGQQMKIMNGLRRKNELTQILMQTRPFVLTALICLPFAEQFNRSAFIAFMVAVAGYVDASGKFFASFKNYFEFQDHLNALTPLLDIWPESSRRKTIAGYLNGHIEVNHLYFAYEDGENILNDVNLKITSGEYVAIVGKSGSGKSTLLRLLLGLETPKSGTIYYNGQDMAELDLSSLRTGIGAVLQDGELFAGDIFANIGIKRPITEKEAWEAAKLAGIADDIAAMPMGMNTIIDDGGKNLSGGQRQRIQIAAALAAKPSILMFDEATSSLDNKTQAIVTDTLSKFKGTRVVIAHRLSTIKDADKILVLDKGSVVENGSFDELMKMNGIFRELMESQL